MFRSCFLCLLCLSLAVFAGCPSSGPSIGTVPVTGTVTLDGNAVEGAMFGVSFGADGQGGFRYAIGVEVDPVPDSLPEGCCAVSLSAGTYAVLRRFGPIAGLPHAMDQMFSVWLPNSAFTQREGAVFERYPNDERNGPDGMAWEIWVPVEPAG